MHLSNDEIREVRRIISFWAPGVPIYAFGSRVHGRNLKRYSDLDLCLKDSLPVPDSIRWKLKDAFTLSDLPMRVDIVDWNDLSPEFRKVIEPDLTPISP